VPLPGKSWVAGVRSLAPERMAGRDPWRGGRVAGRATRLAAGMRAGARLLMGAAGVRLPVSRRRGFGGPRDWLA
jgi:hypothetical protein